MESKLDYYKKRAYAFLYYELEMEQDSEENFLREKNLLMMPMNKRTSAYCELWTKK